MAASEVDTCITLTDTPEQVATKINKHAKSGGGATLEEQRKNGANLEIDVPFQWLKFFLEDDDQLADIEKKYSKGEMLTGEVKKILIGVI